MRIQNYEVSVVKAPFGVVSETAEGYVFLQDGDTFAVQLVNRSIRKCSAEVRLNGQVQGTFVLSPTSTPTVIERGVNDTGKFTFFKLGTEGARLAGLPEVSTGETGLLQVTFKPQKKQEEVYRKAILPGEGGENYRGGRSSVLRSRGFSAGGVGLTGESQQRFQTVAFEEDPDQSTRVVISLRLVCDEKPRPLGGPRPLGNPVPPPVKS